ncbi:uncharacterized protein LOC133901307 [Phragmites australis]|uniref:uncharacterized protein LOC133901307 n=1 Tax=Phragmites australis TaxID=29695 RepID=UPI002D77D7D4|nr:uncharacterized protein LOC133901307 [Phragmites australis]
MAPKRRAQPARSDDSVELGLDGVKEPAKNRPPSPENEGSEEDEGSDKSGDARPARNASAGEVASSTGPKKSMPSGEVAQSPKPKKTRPAPSPKRGKKPPPPSQEEDRAQQEAAAAEEEVEDERVEESGEAQPETDEVAASPRPKRNEPSGEIARSPKPKKTKDALSPAPKRAKKPPPPPLDKEERGQEEAEEEQEVVGASPVRNVPVYESAAASPPRKTSGGENVVSPQHKKRGAASPGPKWAKKPTPPQQQEEDEAEEERAVGYEEVEEPSEVPAATGAPADKTAASSPQRKKRSKPSGDNDKRKEKKKKKKRGKPSAMPLLAESAVEQVGQEPAVNISQLQEMDDAEEEEKKKKRGKPSAMPLLAESVVEQVGQAPAGNISQPQEMDDAEEEKRKRGKPSAMPLLAESAVEQVGQAPAGNISQPQEMDDAEEEQAAAEEDRVEEPSEALPVKNASSAKLRISRPEKKSAVERSWSREDELRILTAMAKHAQTHGGALLEASNLFAALATSFDKRDADTDKLANKVRKLKGWHGRVRPQGCPTDDHGCRLFELCEIVWGNGASQNSSQLASMASRRSRKTSNSSHVVPEEALQEGSGGGEHADAPTGALAVDVGAPKDSSVPFVKDGEVNSGKCEDNGVQVDDDEQAKATFVRREFSELSRLYPDLAKEVKGYAHAHSSGELIMAAFETIGDDAAHDLDARCKKQRIDMFNLEMDQADLTKALLSTLAGRIN